MYTSVSDMVVCQTPLGEVGILPRHAPLMCVVDQGRVRVTQHGHTASFEAMPGVLTVRGDEVWLLTSAWEAVAGGPAGGVQ